MILTKYRMIVGEGYVETQSIEEAITSGYEYITIYEEVTEIVGKDE